MEFLSALPRTRRELFPHLLRQTREHVLAKRLHVQIGRPDEIAAIRDAGQRVGEDFRVLNTDSSATMSEKPS